MKIVDYSPRPSLRNISRALICGLSIITMSCGNALEQAISEKNLSLQNPLGSSPVSTPAKNPGFVTPTGQASVTYAQFQLPENTASAYHHPNARFNVKRCINIGNALEAPREGEWGYTIRDEDLGAVADAGFDTIRLPIRWDQHMQSRAPYAVNILHMRRVRQVVNQARRLGLGVIIDVHHYDALMENPRRETTRFLSLWDQIAREFADAPSNVYFEILNEPTLSISMSQLNALYRQVIPVIRQTNPTRTLIIGGNSWNSVDRMDDVAWPNDPNIVATFHDYGPHEFTHQGAPWMSENYPEGRQWGGRKDLVEFGETYSLARQFQKRTGLPILVGEFGVIDRVPDAQRAYWIKSRRKQIEADGYGWCAWDLDGAFTSYDTKTRQWLPGMLDAFFGP